MAIRAFFDTPIEYLKGVGPQRAELLREELEIFTFGDLIQHYPFRYDDRTKFYTTREVDEHLPFIQVKGRIVDKQLTGTGSKKRLVATFSDGQGDIELIWFQGINWIVDKLKPGVDFVVFGKPSRYGSKVTIAHPEIDPLTPGNERTGSLQPVYPLTEKLRSRHFDSRAISKLMTELLQMARDRIRETLPSSIIRDNKFISKQDALLNIHFPTNQEQLRHAQERLKFEELFYVQLRLLKMKVLRREKYKGQVFNSASLVTEFYNKHLPFALTEAQKRVIREIYSDLRSGKQMNRLLQGDVGSGKTIVAFISMLLIAGNGAQCALMAPTEILAQQHFQNLRKHAQAIGLTIAILTGSTRGASRKSIHASLADGTLDILVGTHALLEESVQFYNLGLAVIDEQHRFGVAQRSLLWQKNAAAFPHVLVMTATPIPRTLAMTLYGDLDVSVIDELPAGRKSIKTIHYYDSHRLQINRFILDQISGGRQIYIVYPLIDESEKLDLKHLMDGYESVCRSFPDVPVSILHGKMKSDAKDFEMSRFVRGETKIMVATTVIEVGVDVPNASVMVIENAERFGLSQLHQLRGRVGRGPDQSYCLLVTNYKLSADSKVRIKTMVNTNNGFEIAETDLQLRGPGDLMGTQQSGVLDLLIADLGKDGQILQRARDAAIRVVEEDPDLQKSENRVIRVQIESMKESNVNWSRIS